jgi:hypothetical protein
MEGVSRVRFRNLHNDIVGVSILREIHDKRKPLRAEEQARECLAFRVSLLFLRHISLDQNHGDAFAQYRFSNQRLFQKSWNVARFSRVVDRRDKCSSNGITARETSFISD